jgi:hypothetical protein
VSDPASKRLEVAVVRLTEPGMPEGDAEVVSEWRGVSYVHTEGTWERESWWDSGLLTAYPTPELVGITAHLDMSNAGVKRLDQRRTLNDRLGLELWFPVTGDGELVHLDPLDPRDDWDTSTGRWVRTRYHSGYVVQYNHVSFMKEMSVNVTRDYTLSEMYRIEVMDR